MCQVVMDFHPDTACYAPIRFKKSLTARFSYLTAIVYSSCFRGGVALGLTAALARQEDSLRGNTDGQQDPKIHLDRSDKYPRDPNEVLSPATADNRKHG